MSGMSNAYTLTALGEAVAAWKTHTATCPTCVTVKAKGNDPCEVGAAIMENASSLAKLV